VKELLSRLNLISIDLILSRDKKYLKILNNYESQSAPKEREYDISKRENRKKINFMERDYPRLAVFSNPAEFQQYLLA
jgi:hypothetical protein